MGDVLRRSGGPSVEIVVAAAPWDGRGHSARALALAEACVAAGLEVSILFVRGSPTERQAAEARRLRVSVGSGEPSAAGVVVLELPDPNEGLPFAPAARLAVYDDREWLRGDAAVVIQPSLPSWDGGDRAHADLVLAGYAYAPVSAAIGARRPSRVVLGGETPQRVLVCFGGSDPEDVSGRLGPAIAEAAARAGGSAEIVVGPDYSGRLREGGRVRVVRDPPDLLDRLTAADLVVIGAGTIKFEAACLGRPMLLAGVVDDQLPVGPPFAETGAAVWLGDGRSIKPEVATGAVERFLGSPAARLDLARSALALVDGEGARRIADALGKLGARSA